MIIPIENIKKLVWDAITGLRSLKDTNNVLKNFMMP